MPPRISAGWRAVLPVALLLLAAGLCRDFTALWTDNIDANGACWSQSAHNTLAAGLIATRGVPSAFYFEPPPIPANGFYTHHPPLFSLLVTASFAVFGEHEWAARLVPIGSSLLALVLLWALSEPALGSRGAAFAVLLFAGTPMLLHYGRMVNFEAVDLVWMLGALLCLRRWQTQPTRGGLAGFVACVLLALWTAWLGYFFALVLCGGLLLTRRREERRLAFVLFALMLVSLVLFLWQIHSVQPEAFRETSGAVGARAAAAGFTWGEWCVRVFGTLRTHLQPLDWLLAVGGAVIVLARKNRADPLRSYVAAALSFFILSAVYVVAFRNASMIHDYASFYFAPPVAMIAAVAIETLLRRWERAPFAGLAVAAILALGWSGYRTNVALDRQFHILGEEIAEPAPLIPELGRKVNASFAPATSVICNFIPTYGPQVYYYAQKQFLNCAYEPDDWLRFIADPENEPVGGIVWLDEPRAASILAALPPGPREEFAIGALRFCLWHPAQ